MTDLCEVVITVPDADWLASFVRDLVDDHLVAGCHVNGGPVLARSVPADGARTPWTRRMSANDSRLTWEGAAPALHGGTTLGAKAAWIAGADSDSRLAQ